MSDTIKKVVEHTQKMLEGHTFKEMMDNGAEVQRKFDAGEITLKDLLPDKTDEQLKYCSLKGGILTIGAPLFMTDTPDSPQ